MAELDQPRASGPQLYIRIRADSELGEDFGDAAPTGKSFTLALRLDMFWPVGRASGQLSKAPE
jgi:hypothetical protein